jgi:hypothetical protein
VWSIGLARRNYYPARHSVKVPGITPITANDDSRHPLVNKMLNKASELVSDAVCQLIFARRRQGLAGTQLPSSARSRPEGYSATTRAKTTEAEQQTPWGVPQIRVSDSA